MKRDIFYSISPLDYRYWDEDSAVFLSENAFIMECLRVEMALAKVLGRRNLCNEDIVREITNACYQVTTEEVYAEEKRIGHDVRALVNCLRRKVSDAAKRIIHLTATSFDIRDSASVLRYRKAIKEVVLPNLIELEKVLITITLREAETLQIGRTHGQHAVPITFGFAMAEYVSRLGNCIVSLKHVTSKLVGKFSGSVGAFNASSLFFDDPEDFEKEVLAELGLEPANHSTQIVHPEPLVRVLCELVIIGGVLANLADDMRHLQRTEIGEVGEEFKDESVGSSTMPQKRNPWNLESAKSDWKIITPRIVTVFMDQISEHQRDLTNSASGRTCPEVVAYVVSMTKRLTRVMKKLRVDKANLERNLYLQGGLVITEALQLILASLGHPEAYDKVKNLTLEAQRSNRPFKEVLAADAELKPYLKKMTPKQKKIIHNPAFYTGIAAQKARKVAKKWADELGIKIK